MIGSRWKYYIVVLLMMASCQRDLPPLTTRIVASVVPADSPIVMATISSSPTTVAPSPSANAMPDAPLPSTTPLAVLINTPVPPTAEGNQITNPEFIGQHNSTTIPGWENIGDGNGNLYVISRASTNKNDTTTGYAAKWGPKAAHGDGVEGVSGYLEQIVSARGRDLTVKITAITVRGTIANYNVYGRKDDGAWGLVWQPFTIADILSGRTWSRLHASTVIAADYDEYKIQLEARWDGNSSSGVKWGDVYFESR